LAEAVLALLFGWSPRFGFCITPKPLKKAKIGVMQKDWISG
jgi:hypothetical protein